MPDESGEPLFTQRGLDFVPTEHTRGPWDPRHQHGGAVAALVARAAEHTAGPGFAVTRLTIELMRPVPLETLAIDVGVPRPGRRVIGVDVSLSAGDLEVEVVRAHAVAIRRSELPTGEGHHSFLEPGPEAGVESPFIFEDDDRPAFHRTGMEVRFVGGGAAQPGPAKAWFRLRRPVVDDEEPSGVQRAAAAADFGNGVSWVLPPDRWIFVNPDLTPAPGPATAGRVDRPRRRHASQRPGHGAGRECGLRRAGSSRPGGPEPAAAAARRRVNDDPSRGDHNAAALHGAIAAVVPERECVVAGDRRLTWREVTDRTCRLAGILADAGLGLRGDPAAGAADPWQSPHDHVALYLHNGPEYLEGMLGAWKARCAAINVNYRYVAAELTYVLRDSDAAAIVYHASFASTLADVLPGLPGVRLLLQVDDGSGTALLDGAADYEAALAAADPLVPTGLTPDDRYILYTGGTTGLPKGVLWRQGDFLATCLGVKGTSADLVASAARRGSIAAHAAGGALHARGRPLERHLGVRLGRHGGRAGWAHPLRPGRRARHLRARARDRPADSGRPVRAAAARRDGRPPVRPLAPALPAVGRRRPVHRRQGPPARADPGVAHRRRPRVVGDRSPGRGWCRADLPPGRPCRGAVGGPQPAPDARRRRDRVARPGRARAPGIPRRRRQDGHHLPGDRRSPPRGGGRSGAAVGGRCHRAAGPRLGDDQHGGREGLRRGGRAGPHRPSRR